MSRVHRNIAKNLSFLNQYAQLTGGEDFSSFMDCSPEEFAAYLDGEPIGIQHLVEIHRYFGIPYEDFLHRDLSHLSPTQFAQLLEQQEVATAPKRKISDGVSIPLVLQEASAVYLRASAGRAPVGPSLSLSEISRAVPGRQSRQMPPRFRDRRFFNEPGVQPGDIVIGEKQESIYDILDGESYVLVLVDGIVLRRPYLLSDDSIFQSFRLFPDNPEYEAVEVRGEDVLESGRLVFDRGEVVLIFLLPFSLTAGPLPIAKSYDHPGLQTNRKCFFG